MRRGIARRMLCPSASGVGNERSSAGLWRGARSPELAARLICRLGSTLCGALVLRDQLALILSISTFVRGEL
jgi:hypothetical protein